MRSSVVKEMLSEWCRVPLQTLKTADRLWQSMFFGQNLDHHGNLAPLWPCLPTGCTQTLADHRQTRPVSPLFLLQDQDKEYVGFATLPNQVHRKSVKKGFDFTLMVAGTIAPAENIRSCGILSQFSFLLFLWRGVRPGKVHPGQQSLSHRSVQR